MKNNSWVKNLKNITLPNSNVIFFKFFAIKLYRSSILWDCVDLHKYYLKSLRLNKVKIALTQSFQFIFLPSLKLRAV